MEQDLDISIEALTPAEETVTTAFHDLPLKEAMQRLSRRVVCMHDDRSNGIAKIVVLPEGEEAAMPAGEHQPSSAPESSKFEFEPARSALNE